MRIEPPEPPLEARVDLAFPFSPVLLLSHLVLLLEDKGHDLVERDPVRVQEDHDLVIRVDDFLEAWVWESHPPAVLLRICFVC